MPTTTTTTTKPVRKATPAEPTAKQTKAIAKLVEHGNHPDTACRACDVPAKVGRRWFAAGRAAKAGTALHRFFDAVLTGQAVALYHAVRTVLHHAIVKRDPEAAVLLLEFSARSPDHADIVTMLRQDMAKDIRKVAREVGKSRKE